MSDYQVIPKFSYDMPKLAKAIKDLDGNVLNIYIYIYLINLIKLNINK